MRQTALHAVHVASGARMVDFSGWDMPVQYEGILAEHLATRRTAGLFDVSHMGRFAIGGRDALPFLRYALTNDAGSLAVGRAQYTLLANESGGALDDAYLYCFGEDSYLLVVNAGNRERDWSHLSATAKRYGAFVVDRSEELAMISLQGPSSARMLASVVGLLPGNRRNDCGTALWNGDEIRVMRTGYAGEPIGFELAVPSARAVELWRLLVEAGAAPVGLGARDTLRLEAALPLYGHELGTDPDGREIPIFSCPLARFGVDLADPEREFVGSAALRRQVAEGTPRVLRKLRVTGRGIVRAGDRVLDGGREVGVVTSGTMVPYWEFASGEPGTGSGMRAIALALLDRDVSPDAALTALVRQREVSVRLAPRFLENRSGRYAVPVLS